MDKVDHQKATISGFRWNFFDQIISQATNLIVGIVLMNLLPPSEFGLIAMATVFTGFLSLFSKFGLSASLVQAVKINQLDIDTVFWSSIIVGIVLGGIMFSLSWPIAFLYGEPRLILIIQVLALIFVIIPIASTPMSLLQRDMEFSKTFKVNVTSVVISSMVAIYLAFAGFGVWALVFQRLVDSIIRLFLSSLVAKFKPTRQFSSDYLKKHLSFGLPYLGSKSFLYWVGNADNFIIGYLMNPNALGLYSRAYALATMPANQLGVILFRVLFPALSKIQSDQNQVRTIILKLKLILVLLKEY